MKVKISHNMHISLFKYYLSSSKKSIYKSHHQKKRENEININIPDEKEGDVVLVLATFYHILEPSHAGIFHYVQCMVHIL